MTDLASESALAFRPRRSAAKRVAFFFSRVQMIAFVNEFAPPVSMLPAEKWHIAEGRPAERMAAADAIIRKLGAAAEWRNGYYMATLGALEIHFDPPIFSGDFSGEAGAA